MADENDKLDAASEILARGSLFVHLDPRLDDVDVPRWYRRQAQLVLQVGYDMPVPIPDLCVNEQGVFGTLAFHDYVHFCMVPWSAVFAMVDEEGKGRVWPGSFPQEIVTEVHRELVRKQLVPIEGGADKGPPPGDSSESLIFGDEDFSDDDFGDDDFADEEHADDFNVTALMRDDDDDDDDDSERWDDPLVEKTHAREKRKAGPRALPPIQRSDKSDAATLSPGSTDAKQDKGIDARSWGTSSDDARRQEGPNKKRADKGRAGDKGLRAEEGSTEAAGRPLRADERSPRADRPSRQGGAKGSNSPKDAKRNRPSHLRLVK